MRELRQENPSLSLQARTVRVRNRPVKCRWCDNDIQINKRATFVRGGGFWHPACWDEYREAKRAYEMFEMVKLGKGKGPQRITQRKVSRLEDLAGVDAGTMSLAEMRRKLDMMRARDRY